MKEPSISDLKKELEAANSCIKNMQNEISKQDKVRRLIVAAGLLSEYKFNQAEDLLDKDA